MSLKSQTNLSASKPPNIRLTERDIKILETIHAFEGMMSLGQIDRLYFSGKRRTQPRHRMRLLCVHGYAKQPDETTKHQVPWGETIYWLGSKGAALLAGMQGQSLKRFQWRKQPRYSQVTHDLAVNDFRLDIAEAVTSSLSLTLREWQPESEFLAQPDVATYALPNGRTQKRQVRPDGFFVIEQTGHPSPYAFLLEIDMGTEDNPRFGREKVLPGLAYLKSPAYSKRFGLRYGRFLIVTTGERRLQNMKAQAERSGGKGLFYFTTFALIRPETVLNQTIWWLAGETQLRSIIRVA